MRIKLLKKHKIGCRALAHFKNKDKDWDTPWSSYPERTVLRRKDGSHRCYDFEGYSFIIFRCTDLDCPAEVQVGGEDILKLIDKFLQ